MNYLKKKFSVPVQPKGVSQEEWDCIFAPKCIGCGRPIAQCLWDIGKMCSKCWRSKNKDL